jgi:hypothetical protein
VVWGIFQINGTGRVNYEVGALYSGHPALLVHQISVEEFNLGEGIFEGIAQGLHLFFIFLITHSGSNLVAAAPFSNKEGGEHLGPDVASNTCYDHDWFILHYVDHFSA